MARYDKYDPKAGGFRAALAADWLAADVEKIYGVGLDTSGRVVKGPGNTGIVGVLVLTKARKAGEIVDVMTSGEIVEFGESSGVAGTDWGVAGTAYYASTTAVSEVQTLTGDATSGQFKLTFRGQETTALDYNDSAADIDAALGALSTIGGAGNVTTAGGALGTNPVTVTFAGDLVSTDVPLLQVTSSTLAGGTVTVVETTPGHSTGGQISDFANSTGSVYVGHTVEAQRLIVRVRPGAAA